MAQTALAGSAFVMGRSEAKEQRLMLQAQLYDRITRRFLEDTGLDAGMTVLDGRRFDDFLLAVTATRRSLLGASLLVILGRAGLSTAEAKKKNRKKKRRGSPSSPPPASTLTCVPDCATCQTCQNGQCVAADGTACPDDGNVCTSDVCQGGACSHPLRPNGTDCGGGKVCESGLCVSLYCAGKSICLGSASAGCAHPASGLICYCFVAVGTGAPHCGLVPEPKSCTATSGCSAGETCIDNTDCPGASATACSAACPDPL